MDNKNKRKKTLIIAGIALLINAFLIYLLLLPKGYLPSNSLKPALSPKPASLNSKRLAEFFINPQNLSVKANEAFTLQINLSTPFPLAGADAILEFNPDYLTVEKVLSSEMFTLFPRLKYDNNTGKVIITGININTHDSPDLPDNSVFAALTLRAKKPGSTIIKFNYKPNSTTSSTAVRAKDSKNILTRINNAKIKIQ